MAIHAARLVNGIRNEPCVTSLTDSSRTTESSSSWIKRHIWKLLSEQAIGFLLAKSDGKLAAPEMSNLDEVSADSGQECGYSGAG